MDQYHALNKTMDQYHGQQNLGSSYKYIMKVSPQTLLVTLFTFQSLLVTLLTFLPHFSMLYVEFTPCAPWFIFPLTTLGGENQRTRMWNPSDHILKRLQWPILQMYVAFVLLIRRKTKKFKNSSFVYCLRQGWMLSLAPWTLHLDPFDIR